MRTPTHPAAVLFLVFFASQSGLVALTPTLPDIATTFGVPTAAVGTLRLGSSIAGGLAALGLATVLRGVPVRAQLAGGLALVGGASVAGALAPSLVLMAVAQLFVGAGIAACVTGAMTAAGDWVAPERRGHALAWAMIGPPMAWIVGMPAAGALAELDWRLACAAVPGVSAFIAGAALLAALPRLPRPTVAEQERATTRFDRAIARYATGETLAYGAWSGALIYSGALLRESHGTSLSTVGLLLGCAAAAYLPGTFVGRRWAGSEPGRLLVRSTFAGAVLVAAFGTVRPGVVTSMVLFCALSFVMSTRMFAGGALAVNAAADRRAAMASARSGAMQVGYVLGAAAGMAALPLGGYGALGIALAALLLLAAAAQPAGRPRGVPALAPAPA